MYQKQKSAASRSSVQLALSLHVPKPSNYFCANCVRGTYQATTWENIMPERKSWHALSLFFHQLGQPSSAKRQMKMAQEDLLSTQW